MSNSVWIIERAKIGTNYWSYYSTEDDISEASEMVERLKMISSAVHKFRGVQYVPDLSTEVTA